jgi:autotransporter-associated beta strand protein
VFAGHIGAALAIGRSERRINVAAFVLAALLLDVVLWLFVLIGWESVVIPSTFGATHQPEFIFPFSHGLLASLVWSAVSGVAVFAACSHLEASRLSAAILVAAIGNLVMIGEGYLAAGQGTNTYLNLNGNTETISGLISSRGFEGNPSDPSRIFIENSLSNSIGTLNIGGNNASSSFAGTIRDFNPTTAGLTSPTNAVVSIGKIGTGTLTLSGTNTYSGGTRISGGALVMGGPSAIGNGGVTLSSGATLDLNGNGATGTPVVIASLNGAGGTITSSTAGSFMLREGQCTR